MDYETRTLSVVILPPSEPIWSELATTVRIDDEGAGEFVVVAQEGPTDIGKIAISPEEWLDLRAAIDRLVGDCRPL
jgi:hypothetical protein